MLSPNSALTLLPTVSSKFLSMSYQFVFDANDAVYLANGLFNSSDFLPLWVFFQDIAALSSFHQFTLTLHFSGTLKEISEEARHPSGSTGIFGHHDTLKSETL